MAGWTDVEQHSVQYISACYTNVLLIPSVRFKAKRYLNSCLLVIE